MAKFIQITVVGAQRDVFSVKVINTNMLISYHKETLTGTELTCLELWGQPQSQRLYVRETFDQISAALRRDAVLVRATGPDSDSD